MLKPLEGNETLVHLDDSFTVQGIGTVVSGLVVSGKVLAQTSLFSVRTVWRVHAVGEEHSEQTLTVEHVEHGTTGSFCIKPRKGHIHKHEIRMGIGYLTRASIPRRAGNFRRRSSS